MKTCNFDTHTQKNLKLLTRHGVLFRGSLRPVHPFTLILNPLTEHWDFAAIFWCTCEVYVKKTKKYKMRWKLIVFLRNYFSEQRTFLHGGCLFVYYNYHVFSETRSTQTQGSNLKNCHMLFILFMFNTTFLKRYSYVYIVTFAAITSVLLIYIYIYIDDVYILNLATRRTCRTKVSFLFFSVPTTTKNKNTCSVLSNNSKAITVQQSGSFRLY